jgi:hypothetical protein
MTKHQDGLLIAVCVVVGLALVSVHGHHPNIGPMGWAGAGGRTVSVSFMAHMIELEVRRVVAAVGTVLTIR